MPTALQHQRSDAPGGAPPARSCERRRRAGVAGALVGWGLAAAGPAAAAQLQVYPVRFALTAAAPSGVMTVSNRAAEDALFQLSVNAWSQTADEDVLIPTRDVLANPGLFRIKGQDQQITRLGLRVAALATERSYRLILQEIPQARMAGGLTTLLRISVPLFVPPARPVKQIDWRLRVTPEGVALVALNTGNVHVQFTAISLTSGNGSPPLARVLNLYALPGAARRIAIDSKPAIRVGTRFTLAAETDQGPFTATVSAEAVGDAPDPR